MISFTVLCVPVAQPRQRHRVFSAGGKTFASNYTPDKHPVNAYKAAVQLAAKQVYSGPPLEGPLSLSLTFVMPRPKSLCRKKDDPGRLWFSRKPDSDNLWKSFCDSLNLLLFKDDSQIVMASIIKCYAALDEQPHVEAEIDLL